LDCVAAFSAGVSSGFLSKSVMSERMISVTAFSSPA
jgi:hypothetical protein